MKKKLLDLLNFEPNLRLPWQGQTKGGARSSPPQLKTKNK